MGETQQRNYSPAVKKYTTLALMNGWKSNNEVFPITLENLLNYINLEISRVVKGKLTKQTLLNCINALDKYHFHILNYNWSHIRNHDKVKAKLKGDRSFWAKEAIVEEYKKFSRSTSTLNLKKLFPIPIKKLEKFLDYLIENYLKLNKIDYPLLLLYLDQLKRKHKSLGFNLNLSDPVIQAKLYPFQISENTMLKSNNLNMGNDDDFCNSIGVKKRSENSKMSYLMSQQKLNLLVTEMKVMQMKEYFTQLVLSNRWGNSKDKVFPIHLDTLHFYIEMELKKVEVGELTLGTLQIYIESLFIIQSRMGYSVEKLEEFSYEKLRNFVHSLRALKKRNKNLSIEEDFGSCSEVDEDDENLELEDLDMVDEHQSENLQEKLSVDAVLVGSEDDMDTHESFNNNDGSYFESYEAFQSRKKNDTININLNGNTRASRKQLKKQQLLNNEEIEFKLRNLPKISDFILKSSPAPTFPNTLSTGKYTNYSPLLLQPVPLMRSNSSLSLASSNASATVPISSPVSLKVKYESKQDATSSRKKTYEKLATAQGWSKPGEHFPISLENFHKYLDYELNRVEEGKIMMSSVLHATHCLAKCHGVLGFEWDNVRYHPETRRKLRLSLYDVKKVSTIFVNELSPVLMKEERLFSDKILNEQESQNALQITKSFNPITQELVDINQVELPPIMKTFNAIPRTSSLPALSSILSAVPSLSSSTASLPSLSSSECIDSPNIQNSEELPKKKKRASANPPEGENITRKRRCNQVAAIAHSFEKQSVRMGWAEEGKVFPVSLERLHIYLDHELNRIQEGKLTIKTLVHNVRTIGSYHRTALGFPWEIQGDESVKLKLGMPGFRSRSSKITSKVIKKNVTNTNDGNEALEKVNTIEKKDISIMSDAKDQKEFVPINKEESKITFSIGGDVSFGGVDNNFFKSKGEEISVGKPSESAVINSILNDCEVLSDD
ncbi:hypothetical protein HDU92_009191 [Lobulomyces angularis]|nr:hypothetical protein HDU92_009191 [Lobulomyces angularis]